MGQILVEVIARVLFEVLCVVIGEWLLGVVGYYTAGLVLPIISLGRIHVAPRFPTPSSRVTASWYTRLPNGTIIVNTGVACWIGILIWVLAILLWVSLP